MIYARLSFSFMVKQHLKYHNFYLFVVPVKKKPYFCAGKYC